MDREKDIEVMAKAIAISIGYGCDNRDHCDMSCQNFKCGCIPYECAEILYNADYRKQEWISVDERLPDCCGMPVLMVAVNQYSQTRVVKGFTDYQCPITFHTNEREYDSVWGAWDVTHWMPLPEPPKGE